MNKLINKLENSNLYLLISIYITILTIIIRAGGKQMLTIQIK